MASKQLVIWDVDDTLFFANQLLAERCPDGNILGYIDNKEFHRRQALGENASRLTYERLEDAHDFHSSIRPNWKMIQQYHTHLLQEDTDIVFVTGRTTVKPIEKFIQAFQEHTIDLQMHELVFAGNHNPGGFTRLNKRIEFERYFACGYSKIEIYDDHAPNIDEFYDVAQSYPDITIRMWLVDELGEASEYEPETTAANSAHASSKPDSNRRVVL
jgi:hypothetical protein